MRKLIAGKKNHQFQIKFEDLQGLLAGWVRGDTISDMFLSLPVLLRSRKKPKISDWAEGLSEPTVWDDDFDKFCDVVKLVFEDYLPWLMSACQTLSVVSDGWAVGVDWHLHSQYVRYGVDSGWGVAVFQSGLSAERRPVATVGRAIPDSWLSSSDPTGARSIRTDEALQNEFGRIIQQFVDEGGGSESPKGLELTDLRTQFFQSAGIDP